MDMTRALLTGPRSFRIEQQPAPDVEPGDVLIAIRACGVCPSDVRFYSGARAGSSYPRTVGHEWVGEVIAVGPDASGYAVGDRVAAFGQRVCGMCRNCQRGMSNMCLSRLRSIQGGFQTMGRAVPEALMRIPDDTSYAAASFAEPLACCLNGVLRTPITPGDAVVIMGVGPIGQMLAQLARLRGGRVIAIDMLPERLELALELGASEGLDAADPDLVERVQSLTGGLGAEAVIVAVGAPAAEAQALLLAAPGGCVNYFAGTYPSATIPVDPNLIHYKQLWVTGAYHFTPGGFGAALELIARHEVEVEPLISHRLGLNEIARGFDIVMSQQGMKVVIEMDGA